jgi:diguanylate cyclase (GGDEF)-like protein
MARTLGEIEKRFADLEKRFTEIEGLNLFLTRQTKEYYLLYDSIRKLNSAGNVKEYYKILDKIFKKNFDIDEYALFLKNKKSDILSVYHSMGLSKRKLKEIFYKISEGLVGKVFAKKKSVYIPDLSTLNNFFYYYEKRVLRGSIFYLPVLNQFDECIGVLKFRKILKDSFSEIERSVLQNLQNEFGSVFQNIQKIELLNSKSYLDELTQLYNRRYYNEHYPIEFKRAQRYQHELSIMFIDIDDFKNINDTYGHVVGDNILQNVATFIQNYTRSSDIGIRYGGDEFLILLPETTRESAFEVAEKLKKSVGNLTVNIDGQFDEVAINLSIGIANYPRDTIEPQMLIELADRALYKAKKAGKDRIVMV